MMPKGGHRASRGHPEGCVPRPTPWSRRAPSWVGPTPPGALPSPYFYPSRENSRTQFEQISNVQKDLLANNAKQDNLHAYGIKTRGGTHTQDPLYPEGHPKRIEQDSQVQVEEIVSSPNKKKKKK